LLFGLLGWSKVLIIFRLSLKYGQKWATGGKIFENPLKILKGYIPVIILN